MALLAIRDLSKTYASHTLFDRLSLAFHAGERVGLIGPNGAGKSTLLRILAGLDAPDSGVVESARGAHIAYLPQEDVFPVGATAEGSLLSALHDFPMEEHERPVRARKMLRRLGFERGEVDVSTLSGGWRKRLALGCRLVQEPDLLLMDEPTNHLDLAGIDWLERFLERASFAFVVTSHDRTFLERTVDRIIEIHPRYRDGFFSSSGRYSDFLERREAFLEMEDAERRALASDVRREVEWLRRGPSARGTKAVARIDAAHGKIEELADARRRAAADRGVEIDFSPRGRRTRDLVTAEDIAKTLGGRRLFDRLDVHVRRGDRLGIVGNNASGKTTLLRVLAGDIAPDTGRVRHAADLRVARFDQQRQQLDRSERLRTALCPSGDTVSYLGRPAHIIPWAKRFGFRADQLDTPVGELSGGEQARVLMALMIREPVDVLMLDEPTNDLDIGSIEVLESALLEFPGAVVLITHDRQMLDRVCTDLIGLHDDGHPGHYGSVAQWIEADARTATSPTAREVRRSEAPRESRSPRPGLNYLEKKEWATMEDRALAAEREVERWQAELDSPEVATDHERLHAAFEAHRIAKQELDALLARWEELERKQLGSA